MRKSSKIISAAAIAVLATAGGTAFTATGVDRTAADSQYIGGTVSQTVHGGATLSDIAYGYADGPTGPKTTVTSVTVTFADRLANGRVVTVVPDDGQNVQITCPDVATDTHLVLGVPTDLDTSSTTCTGFSWTELDGLSITVV